MSAPHEILAALAQKPSRIVCGLMSGTSVDAVDVALVRIAGCGRETEAELLQFHEAAFADEVRELILTNSEVSTSTVSDICVLNTLLAGLYAEAVEECCVRAGMSTEEIDLVGMHGQTLYHLPDALDVAGHAVRGTFQAGNAPALAAALGAPVVSDFRSADMARGGQGAPLVPYADYILYHSEETNRALVNIGGIANITWLPAHGAERDVLAYDAGPGNMVVDALMRYYFDAGYDDGGATARRGRLNRDLFGWMTAHPYFRKSAPKTTGREAFGQAYIDQLLEMAADFDITDPADIIATASQLTVSCIATELRAVADRIDSCAVYVSGGGAKNAFFMEGLRHALGPDIVYRSEDIGINGDAKEAMCFAVLANEWLFGNRANILSVTGAPEKALLGSISIP